MKVLVTGSKGFLGTHTLKYLQAKGHSVTGIDMDNDIFAHGLPDEKFDVIIHFAAYVGGRKGIDNKGTPMREDMAGGETFDMYGMSKLATECMLKFAKIKSHIMRPFTIYGPGQSMDYPLPAIIDRAKRGECSVWGSGTQVRDWVHIDDALRVFEYLLHRDDPVVLNIGTGIPMTFKEVAQTIYKEIHGDYSLDLRTQTDQPEGAGYRYADISLLKTLGLEPRISFAEGVRSMI